MTPGLLIPTLDLNRAADPKMRVVCLCDDAQSKAADLILAGAKLGGPGRYRGVSIETELRAALESIAAGSPSQLSSYLGVSMGLFWGAVCI